MTQYLVTNFATTTLQTPNPMTAGYTGTFTVSTGQGALFPTSNFCVTIDSEILYIDSRTGDTFTIDSAADRGFDNTVAASHMGGGSAVVQQSAIAYMFNHLWSNVPDTFIPEVPPAQASLDLFSGGIYDATAGTYDREWDQLENYNAWTTQTGSSIFAPQLPSIMVFLRQYGDNGNYTTYTTTSLSSSSAFTFNAKVFHGTSWAGSATDTAQLQFFVSDQADPSQQYDGGGRFRIFVEDKPSSGGIRTVIDATTTGYNSNSPLSPTANPPHIGPLYLRITYDGAGTYRGFYSGDGVIFWALPYVSGKTFTPLTFGFTFATARSSGQFLGQQGAIDYVRYSPSVQLPYGQNINNGW